MKRLVLGLCLAQFLASTVAAADGAGVQVDVLAKRDSSWDGSRLPAYPEGAPEISVLRIRIPPGAKLPQHRHPVINAGVLLSGTLSVVTEDGKKLVLNAGDSIVEVVNKPHYGKNESDQIAEIIVFYAGTAGAPLAEKSPE